MRLLNHVTDARATRRARRVCMLLVCPPAYVGSSAFLSFKFDYFGEHFSITPTIAVVNILHPARMRAKIPMQMRKARADGCFLVSSSCCGCSRSLRSVGSSPVKIEISPESSGSLQLPFK